MLDDVNLKHLEEAKSNCRLSGLVVTDEMVKVLINALRELDAVPDEFLSELLKIQQ
jgi:hypothetical protein